MTNIIVFKYRPTTGKNWIPLFEDILLNWYSKLVFQNIVRKNKVQLLIQWKKQLVFQVFKPDCQCLPVSADLWRFYILHLWKHLWRRQVTRWVAFEVLGARAGYRCVTAPPASVWGDHAQHRVGLGHSAVRHRSSEWMWLCSSKTVFVYTISYTFLSSKCPFFKKTRNASRACASSLYRGCANLCILPTFSACAAEVSTQNILLLVFPT